METFIEILENMGIYTNYLKETESHLSSNKEEAIQYIELAFDKNPEKMLDSGFVFHYDDSTPMEEWTITDTDWEYENTIYLKELNKRGNTK